MKLGSWVGLAAMTQSEITIKNVRWEYLGQMPSVFRKLGITLEQKGDDIYIPAHTDGYEVSKLYRWIYSHHFQMRHGQDLLQTS